MHCFYHSQIEAVGKCQACAKGLCRECAHDVESGIVCKGYCEDKVRIFQNLAKTHVRCLAGSGRSVLVFSLTTALIGFLLILLGLRFPGPLFLIPILGMGCVLLGLSSLYRKRDYLKNPGSLRQAETLVVAGEKHSVSQEEKNE